MGYEGHWGAAIAADEADVPATVADLIDRYLASRAWTDLRASTREIEGCNVNAICLKFGGMPLTVVERKGSRGLFLAWHDELARNTPRAADAKLARLACIFSFGLDHEAISRNPLASFRRAYSGDRSEIIWLPEDFAAFNAKAGPEMQLAAFLALHTGQRRGDIIALRWSQYDGKAIRLMQSKTGAKVFIPCTKALKLALDDLRVAALAKAVGARIDACPILTSPSGCAWTVEAFKSAWRRAFRRTGITADLHFHDIRGTAVTMLAEAGCSVPEIASITGHTLASAQKIIDRYLARTSALATSAIAKLEVRLLGR